VGLADEWGIEVGVPVTVEPMTAPLGYLPHKQLESYPGFLVYVSRTYPAMVPYLKGIHLTLDSWRANRDEDGWRQMNAVEPRLDIEERIKAPKFVKAAARLKQDVGVLMSFTDVRAPPSVPIRPTSVTVAHLWGDASGAGFFSSLWIEGEGEIYLVYGTWDEEVTNQSSNFREAYNLVLRVEQMVRDGRITRGAELWLFRDNMVSERSFFKGSNKNPELHGLCLSLR
jgi:hypothetical protein